jgi:hypothetical protein
MSKREPNALPAATTHGPVFQRHRSDETISGHPHTRHAIGSRMAEIQAEQRRETRRHSSSAKSCKRAPCVVEMLGAVTRHAREATSFGVSAAPPPPDAEAILCKQQHPVGSRWLRQVRVQRVWCRGEPESFLRCHEAKQALAEGDYMDGKTHPRAAARTQRAKQTVVVYRQTLEDRSW